MIRCSAHFFHKIFHIFHRTLRRIYWFDWEVDIPVCPYATFRSDGLVLLLRIQNTTYLGLSKITLWKDASGSWDLSVTGCWWAGREESAAGAKCVQGAKYHVQILGNSHETESCWRVHWLMQIYQYRQSINITLIILVFKIFKKIFACIWKVFPGSGHFSTLKTTLTKRLKMSEWPVVRPHFGNYRTRGQLESPSSCNHEGDFGLTWLGWWISSRYRKELQFKTDDGRVPWLKGNVFELRFLSLPGFRWPDGVIWR